MTRICARPGCGESLDHLRADARYHSSTCRREAARQRQGFSGPRDAPAFDWAQLAPRSVSARQRVRTRYARRAA